MFWDHETILPRRARHPFTDTYKAGAQILAHPEARLARLVQISQDELRSLTLQFGHGGLTGMSFNNSPRKTSTENPWPFVTVTHTLQRGEKITSFHLVMQGQHNGPYIVVKFLSPSCRLHSCLIYPMTRIGTNFPWQHALLRPSPQLLRASIHKGQDLFL